MKKRAESKCELRQKEIEFYRRYLLELPECILVTNKSVKPETCKLKNICAQELEIEEERK